MFEVKSFYKFFFRQTLKYFRHRLCWWIHIRNEKIWTINLAPSFVLSNDVASIIAAAYI